MKEHESKASDASEKGKDLTKDPAKEAAKEQAKGANPANIVVRAEWARLRLWQIQFVRDIAALSLLLAILWLGYELSIVTVPLLLAIFLAYLLEPLVKRAVRSGKFSRQGVAAGFIAIVTFCVVVPAIIGLAVAVVQGVGYASEMAKNVTLLVQSVEDSTDMQKRAAVASRGPLWGRMRDYIVTQDAKYRQFAPQDDEPTKTIPAGESGSGNDSNIRPPASDAKGAAKDKAGEAAPPRLEVKPQDVQLAKPDAEPVVEPPIEPVAGAEGSVSGSQAAAGVVPKVESSKRVSSDKGGRLLAMEEAGHVASGEKPSDLYILLRRSLDWVRNNLETLSAKALQNSGGVAGFIAGFATGTAGRVGGLVFGAFLTAFFFFFICTGWGRALRFWQSLIPERKQNRVFFLVGKMDEVIAGFVRGRITICGILMLYYTVGFWLVGVPAWLLMGPLMGALVLIPYAQILGYFVAILLMALQPGEGFQGAWWWILGAPLALVTLGQFMDDYILTPRIQGKSTNMDTPTILFASIAGGSLAGVYGLLVAIPVAACIKILLKEVFWPRFKAWAEGKERDFLPLER